MRILDQNSTETVELKHVEQARQDMIIARETHLDALGERLRDPRIRRIIEPVITGDIDTDLGRTNPDVMLAMDLGLVQWTSETGLIISNPIYTEILTRHLNSGYHDILPPPSSWQWQNPDGSLNMDSLLKEFQLFWRENSEFWESKTESAYTEAFPHLLLMAFLQRILNGGGNIERECAAGRGRMDLSIEYNNLRYIIEIKLLRSYNSPEAFRKKGIEQVLKYRDKFGAQVPTYLIIFDRCPESKTKSWDERIFWERDGEVTVIGC